MCRKFISENFEEDILYTFNKLKPGAYKADLWRYCILYKKGGIYLDIKYSCVNGFKLIYLTDKEYYVRDRTINNINCGIYNGLIVSLPYNNSLLKAIYNIVENVKNVYYSSFCNHYLLDSLAISGPLLLSKQFNKSEIDNFTLSFSNCSNYININNVISLEIYKEYFNEKIMYIKEKNYYTMLYKNKNIYNFLDLKPIQKINLSRTLKKSINNIEYQFFSSNPCIINHPHDDNNRYIINIRWINYSLNTDGIPNLLYKKNISLNSYFVLDNSFNRISEEIFLNEICDYNEPYSCFGYENIKLFNYLNKIYYLSSTFNNTQNIMSLASSEWNIISNNNNNNNNKYTLNKNNIIIPSFYNYKKNENNEKNWSFVNYKEKLCVIYKWYPITICEINYDNKTLNLLEHIYIKPEFFKNAKGSTSGFTFNNEIWFVLHLSQSTNYQHFFSVFDLQMNLLRYSEPFKLDNCSVEFCIGLIIEEKRTILSFSSLDTTIYIGIYDNNYIKNDIKWYNN